jgi:hypothetical protein
MAPCGDGRDDDWYQYGLDDFPPLCSAPPPLALLRSVQTPWINFLENGRSIDLRYLLRRV